MEEFLRRVLPSGGDFVITAIRPGPKVPGSARELVVKTQADAATAIRHLSTKALNLYIGIGSFENTRKKPRAKRALYLDLDSKDFGDSKLRCLKELSVFCRATGWPVPAIIVDSGNGYHCYWPFHSDLDVTAWRALAIKLKEKCAELGFAADPPITADAARILRIPTTLNYKTDPPKTCTVLQDNGAEFDPPSLLKILMPSGGFADLAGLPPAPAKLLNMNGPGINADLGAGLDYDKPDAELVASALAAINIPDTGIERRGMWKDILAGLNDWSGGNEEGFKLAADWSATQPGYVSEGDVRKTWNSFGNYKAGARTTIGTVLKLAKDAGWSRPAEPEAEQPAEVTMPEDVEVPSEIDPESGAFASRVSSAIRKFRTEAVEKATAAGKRRAPQGDMEELLVKQFVYVKNQDTYYSLITRDIYSKESIRDIYTPDMPKLKSGPMDPCDMLRRSPKKVVVDSLGFHPGEPTIFSEDGRDYVNRYQQPDPEIVPTPQEARLFADFMDYCFPREEDKLFRKYYLQCLGHVVQRPGIKIATALLFISEAYGIGKSTVAFEIPRRVVGIHNSRNVTNEILERPFTGYLGEAHLLHLQEVHVNGHWNASAIANRLKSVITDSTVNVHKKGKDDYDIPNRLFVTATSNYRDAMYITSNQERRWGVFEMRPIRPYTTGQKRQYFNLIHKFLASPRASGVLRYIFGRINLTGFDPQNPPPTTMAKTEMARLSMSEDQQVVLDAFLSNSPPFHKDVFHMDEVKSLIFQETGKQHSRQKISGWLSKAVAPAKVVKQIRLGSGKLWVWAHQNHHRWEAADAGLIMDELKRQ